MPDNINEKKTLPALALFKRMTVYVRPYTKKLIFAVFAMGIVSACTAAMAWLVQPILDEIFIKKDGTMLKLLPLAVLAVYAIKGTFKYLSSYLMIFIGQTVVRDIRTLLYQHIKNQSLRFFHENPTGLLMSRITNDVGIIQESVSKVLADLCLEIFTMITLLFVVFYRDATLATYAILVLPFSFYFLSKVGKRLRKLSRSGQERMADMNVVLNETFSGAKIVKAFGMEEYETKRFSDENNKYLEIQRKSTKYNEMTAPIMEFLGSIGIAVIIWYGGSKVIEGVTTPGNFFSFLTALMMLYAPIRKLSRINNTIQAALAAFERINTILETEPEIQNSPRAKAIQSFNSEIEFDDVSFSYNTESPDVIRHITLNVKRGEIVAFVGQSGAGKSTLMDLLPRFYDVTSGRILIDGTDIRELSIQDLRSLIGIVTQDCFLFNDTLKNNICYGDRTASMEKIVQSATHAHADLFIQNLPEKYETMVGEKGVKLSGGQKQRIAIARALIKNPPILILDEATSALDTESERIVQDALNKLMENRTTLVIAHRLSTIIHADKIVVMEQGEIIETGSHKELLAKNGTYTNLYNTQFRHNAPQDKE